MGLKEMAQKKLAQVEQPIPAEGAIIKKQPKWERRNLDPRMEDLNDDHEFWHYVLNSCYINHPENPDLLAGLIFVRAIGAQIKNENGNLVIRPVIDETGKRGWVSAQAYQLWLENRNFKRFFPAIGQALVRLKNLMEDGEV